MKKAVFGIARTRKQAEDIFNKLEMRGFKIDSISALFQDIDHSMKKKSLGSMGHEKHTKGSEGAATGTLAGGIIGGTIGLLAGIGSLAIPGLGAFIAAGPLMAALSGSAVGGSLGLMVGTLIGLDIPEYEAKRYEDSLKHGNLLISVHCDTAEQIDLAKDIFKMNDIEDISVVIEAKTK